MNYTATLRATATHPRRLATRVDAPALSAWTLGFALVAYLALREGGYDTIVRSEVGIAVWWVTLLAALAGFLPARIGRAGWVAIGLLGGFALWTGIAISWSQSAEQSVIELGREATYLGFLVLAIALQGRTAARHTINGVACAIGLVTVIALLSRLHPQAFPVNVQFEFLGAGAGRRLSYPLNYWNALAAFAAIGVPLFLALAIGARTTLARAAAAAVLPLSTLCIYLTVSRGGVFELAVAVVVFLLLVPRRIDALATLLIAGAGAAILVWSADRRPAVRTGLRDTAAIHAGNKLLLIAIVVCLGVALLQASVTLIARNYERPAFLRVSRRATTRAALLAACLAIVVALAAGVPGKLDHQWQVFKAPTGQGVNNATVITRLSAISGDGRYQYWVAAVHAYQTRPWGGIGPGTFRFWWASHATVPGPVLNAHSLYMETLAETGFVGLALLLGLFLFVLAVAVRRALREHDAVRIWVAAAAAGFAAFMAAAAVDWVWQMAALVAAALALAAVVLAGRGDDHREPTAPIAHEADPPAGRAKSRVPRRIAAWTQRAGIAVTAIAALVAIAIPLAGAIAIRDSQNAAQRGDLAAAYRDALTAEHLQPYAGSPYLQQALVLEAAHELRPAAAAARVATTKEPTDWQIWLTLARIETERGAYHAAVAALDRARRLNPRGSVFINA
ncbi:MAG: O-antigen ligase family protein [Conexibacteraceae bacterium]|nr:O-antigen ligase family protein [Conexibacteraceae bacterium]